jgi:23S rRNA G2445 N2-methylase RlmL
VHLTVGRAASVNDCSGCLDVNQPGYVQGSLALASHSIEAARVKGSVRLRHGSCASWQLPAVPDMVVTNPPWGRRLLGSRSGRLHSPHDGNSDGVGESATWHDAEQLDCELEAAWLDLKRFLRDGCCGASLWAGLCEPCMRCSAGRFAQACIAHERVAGALRLQSDTNMTLPCRVDCLDLMWQP